MTKTVWFPIDEHGHPHPKNTHNPFKLVHIIEEPGDMNSYDIHSTIYCCQTVIGALIFIILGIYVL